MAYTGLLHPWVGVNFNGVPKEIKSWSTSAHSRRSSVGRNRKYFRKSGPGHLPMAISTSLLAHSVAKTATTPTKLTSDIEVIDGRIIEELDSLRDNRDIPEKSRATHLGSARLRHAEQPEFLTGLRIPSYRNGNPCLLFHNLDVYDDKEIEMIFGGGAHLYVVINCALNPSHHRLQVHLQHIRIRQNSAHAGRPH